jgi:hypothetical protein
MQNAAEAELFTGKNLRGTFRGEVAHADQPFWLEDPHDFAQMFVARSEQFLAFRRWQFLGHAIPAAALKKSQRTVVHDQVLAEKLIGHAESFGEQPPQPLATDLAPRTGETLYSPFGMLVRRTTDLCFDAEPVAHGSDLAKRHAGLHHAEGAGIHADKQHALLIVGVTPQIRFMRRPGVTEGVVNVRDRRGAKVSALTTSRRRWADWIMARLVPIAFADNIQAERSEVRGQRSGWGIRRQRLGYQMSEAESRTEETSNVDSRSPETLARFPNGQCSPSGRFPAGRIQLPTSK